MALPAIVVTAVRWAERPLAAVGACGYLATLAVLSEVDLAEHRLPNRVVGPLAAVTMAWVGLAGITGGDTGRAVRAWAVGLAVAAGFLVLAVVADVGMGDVKLSLPVGVVAGWLGIRAGQATALVALAAGGVVSAALIASGHRHSRLPFGPFLALGALGGLLVAAPH